MIQRIQSLYLLLITALLIAVLFLPFGVFQTPDTTYEYTAFSIKQAAVGSLYAMPVWALAVISVVSATLAFVTIFFYKKRKVQIRLCFWDLLLMVLFYFAYAIFLVAAMKDLNASLAVGYGLFFPLIAIILDYLTVLAIRKDEALVKSWDRIR